MKKILTIAWKDTLIRLRDRSALILMIVAPLVISAIIGAAFGNLSSGSSPITNIAIAIVNDDDGDLGQLYEGVLTSNDLSDLLAVQVMSSLEDAISLVENGEIRAVVHVPADFSENLLSSLNQNNTSIAANVNITTDPTANISPYIIRSIVTQISNSYNTTFISSKVAADGIIVYADLLGPAMNELNSAISESVNDLEFGENIGRISLSSVETKTDENQRTISALAYFAPNMAIFFLMFSVFAASRSILSEEIDGTLHRMMSTPTSYAQIILGKIGGAFFTGLVQMTVLVFASQMIFDLYWGKSIAGLILMSIAIVAAATSLGAFVASIANDANQAGIIGSAVTMISAALGGTFFPAAEFSGWIEGLSKLAIPRWGSAGFTDLTIYDRGFQDILPEAGILIGFAIIFFIFALVSFRRRFVR